MDVQELVFTELLNEINLEKKLLDLGLKRPLEA